MKCPSTDQVVYNCMFPKPRTTDPQNFQGLLQRHLVPEVRLETQAFYGHLLSQEAKYPGLDYSHQPHRVRLSRYPWHRRLFRAFDSLGLTKHEIAALTKWEGTRWAKERFEREQGIFIRDTTADGIEEWIPPQLRSRGDQLDSEHDILNEPEDDAFQTEYGERIDTEDETRNSPELENEMEDSDSEMQSVGLELNERLRAAVAQREAGDYSATLDEAWEKWLHEHSTMDDISNGTHREQSPLTPLDPSPSTSNTDGSGARPLIRTPDRFVFSRWLVFARAGQWNSIPEFMHPFVRQELSALTRRGDRSLGSQDAPSSPTSSRTTPFPPSLSSLRTAGQSAEFTSLPALPRSDPISEEQTIASRSDLLTPPPEDQLSSSATMRRLLTNRGAREITSTRSFITSPTQNINARDRSMRYSLLSSRRDPRVLN